MEELQPQAFDSLVGPLWDFLAPSATPEPCDALFVFGGLGLEIPQRAAELYSMGVAPICVITGGSGPLTQGVFKESEARVFADIMAAAGVPAERMIVEETARNSGQNVSLGMDALINRVGVVPTSVSIVCKSFIARRAIATFALQYPDVRAVATPPKGRPSDFIDRPQDEFVQRLIDEVGRLDSYVASRFIAPIEVPESVRAVVNHLRSRLDS